MRYPAIKDDGGVYAVFIGFQAGLNFGNHPTTDCSVRHHFYRRTSVDLFNDIALSVDNAGDVGQQQKPLCANCGGNRARGRIGVDI